MSDAQTPNPTPTPAKKRKWPRVLLAVSLTLNLLVIGLILGAKLGDHRNHGFDTKGPDRGAIRDLGFAPLAGAFDRADRRHIGKALREKTGSFADNRKALEREFQDMLNVLRADTFEADILLAQMEKQSSRLKIRGETVRALVVERIGQMDTNGRREFADRIEKMVRRRSH